MPAGLPGAMLMWNLADLMSALNLVSHFRVSLQLGRSLDSDASDWDD